MTRSLLALRARLLRGRAPRLLLTAGSVVAASALLVGVLTMNHSFVTSVRRSALLMGEVVDAEVRGVTGGGVDDELVDDIAAHPHVAHVVPVLRGRAAVGDEVLLVLGLDVGDASGAAAGDAGLGELLGSVDLEASRVVDPVLPAVVAGPDVALPAAGDDGARALALDLGGPSGRDAEVAVAGSVRGRAAEAVNGGRFVATDAETARRLLGRGPGYDAALVTARDGVEPGDLREDLVGLTEGRAVVRSPDVVAREAEATAAPVIGGGLVVALLVAAVAALVAYNAASLMLLEERRELATLRTLGARRRAAARAVVAQYGLVGGACGVVGAAVGVLLAQPLIADFPTFLVDVFEVRIVRSVPPYALLAAVVLGAGCCALGAAVPVRRALAAAPVEVLRDAALARPDPAPAGRQLATLGAGVAALPVALVAGWALPTLVGPAVVLGVAGVVLVLRGLMPQVGVAAGGVARRLGRHGALPGIWLQVTVRRTWASVLAVALAVLAVVAQQQVRTNLVDSMTAALGSLDDAALYVSTTPAGGLASDRALAPALEQAVAGEPGVARVAPHATTFLSLGDDVVLLEGVAPGARLPALRDLAPEALDRLLAGEVVVVSRSLGASHGVGDRLTLPSPDGPRTVEVGAVVDSFLWDGGVVMVAVERLEDWYRRPATDLQVFAEPGTDVDDLRDRLTAVVAEGDPHAHVFTGDELAASAGASIEQATVLFDAVALLTVVAGWFAVANSMVIAVVLRRRDLGVLRSQGARRRDVGTMVLVEAFAVGVVGVAAGLLGAVPVHVLELRALAELTKLPLDYRLDAVPLVTALVAAPVLAVLAAIGPAWRATRLPVLSVLREE